MIYTAEAEVVNLSARGKITWVAAETGKLDRSVSGRNGQTRDEETPLNTREWLLWTLIRSTVY